MLFNSVEFLFFFLPVLLFAFFRLGRHSRRLAALWLTAGSLLFYGWWNPAYLGLLLASIVFNYLVGYAIARGNDIGSIRRKRLLTLGITVDLALLGYYKYANFSSIASMPSSALAMALLKSSYLSAFRFSPSPRLPSSWMPLEAKPRNSISSTIVCS